MKSEDYKVFLKEIDRISYDILDNIVSKICEIGPIMADIYLADIGCYTFNDEEEFEKIRTAIQKRYKLDPKKQLVETLTETTPLALIALQIMDEQAGNGGVEEIGIAG